MVTEYTHCCVYAYISTPANTTTTNAGDWYRLEGTFTNEILRGFSIPATLLTYNGQTRYFQITILGSFTSDTNGTELTLGIYKNGVLEANSQMITYLKTSGEYYAMGLCDIISLADTNTLEIRIKSNQAGANIQAVTLTTSAITV